jgi:hypothetical protein
MAIIRGREPVGSITAFKNDLKMGAAFENPWTFIATNGLKVVQEPI